MFKKKNKSVSFSAKWLGGGVLLSLPLFPGVLRLVMGEGWTDGRMYNSRVEGRGPGKPP